MPPTTRESVLHYFEKHRAEPGSDFDESHFLDYLLSNPKSRGAIRNSFGGLRRYNAFLDDIQLQFAVCFSSRDFETNFSLQKFIERIAVLQRSPQSSMASLHNRQKRGFGWGGIFILNLAAAILIAAASRLIPMASYLLAALCLLADLAVLRFYMRWKAHLERLNSLLITAANHNR